MRNSINVSYRYSKQPTRESEFFSVLHRIWQRWIAQLTCSNEPSIWQTSDRWGNTWWHAHHPATGWSATRESQTEILRWLDNPYNP